MSLKPLRRTQIIASGILIAALIIGGYVGYERWQLTHRVPSTFNESRALSSEHAQAISELSQQVAADVALAQQLQLAGRRQELRVVLTRLHEQTIAIRAEARSLSKNLEDMARATPSIRTESAQPFALTALQTQLEMVTRVVNYTTYLNELFGILDARIAFQPVRQERIAQLIALINKEVAAIDELSTKSNDQLKAFDEQLRASAR